MHWTRGNNRRSTKSLGKTRSKTVNLLGRNLDDCKKCDPEKPRLPSHCDVMDRKDFKIEVCTLVFIPLISLDSFKLLIEIKSTMKTFQHLFIKLLFKSQLFI